VVEVKGNHAVRTHLSERHSSIEIWEVRERHSITT